MKPFLLIILMTSSALAQYPKLPTIQDLRKTHPKVLGEAGRDAMQYLRTFKKPKAFDVFAEKWLGDRAPVGFACLEHQLLIQKRLRKDFFLGNRLLNHAIRKSPTYGRPFLIRLLTNEKFPRHEVAMFFLEVNRLGYSTYWFPTQQWYSLLADYLTDSSSCGEMVSYSPGEASMDIDIDSGKVTEIRKPDVLTKQRVYRYEAAYALLPNDLKSPDIDVDTIDPKNVRKHMKPILEKVSKACERLTKRNEIWAGILNYRKQNTTPDALKTRLDNWCKLTKQPERLRLKDLEYLVYLLMREVQRAEKGSKEALAGAKIIAPEVMRVLELGRIRVDKPGKAEFQSLGNTRLWLRQPLEKLAKAEHRHRVRFAVNGFWQWAQDLDPSTVDEHTMLSPPVKKAQ